jgi:hypothetical protein
MSRPRKPVSEKQLAANRANAAKSTGPRTPEGNARSSQNARKHGFTASTFAVVRLEDLDEIAHLRVDLIAVYQPVNSQELFAIERLALTQQAILRGARLESGLFTTCLNEALDPCLGAVVFMAPELSGNGDIEITRAQNRNHALGEGFHRLVKHSNSWSLALRYQAQAERHYRRAVEEFDRLKALRPELPNEPGFDPQPEPTETTCAPADEPVAPSSARAHACRLDNPVEATPASPGVGTLQTGVFTP